MSAWAAFDALCGSLPGCDVAAKIEGGDDYAWSCELRVTVNPNDRDGPDRSLVFYSGGAADGESALAAAIAGAVAARSEIDALRPTAYQRWDGR